MAGPGENRFLQCVFLVLSSVTASEESPGIPSGLLFKTVPEGLLLPKLNESITSCPICTRRFSFVEDLIWAWDLNVRI